MGRCKAAIACELGHLRKETPFALSSATSQRPHSDKAFVACEPQKKRLTKKSI